MTHSSLRLLTCLLCACVSAYYSAPRRVPLVVTLFRAQTPNSQGTAVDPAAAFEIEKLPWGGDLAILRRKKQVPTEAYGPKDVIRICLLALQSNDDPQLDHGAAVVMQFKSPNGLLSQGGLDPAQYGRFLRGTEPYTSLLDFKSAELVGEIESIEADASAVRQSVRLVPYAGPDTIFDFFLSQFAGTWRVDVILHRVSGN